MKEVSKTDARAQWKNQRSQIAEWPSHEVCRFIVAQPIFQNARQVGIFSARTGEVDLTELWIARPEACVFPRVVPPDRLAFRQVSSLTHLRPGYAKIAEPGEDSEPAKEWTSSDLILVPGMAFDMTGSRVGTGVGFYDRFLAVIPTPAWGVGWDRQVLERVAQDPTDVRMRAICTESGIRFMQ